jgi:NAD(P)-dependent dehydrogenase (short-subunit alcohol dehydrogenase family)
MAQPVCLISGVGPGTGSALVHRFAERYQVAMLARSQERLDELAQEVPGAYAFACDVSDAEALQATLGSVRDTLGAPSVLVHNAVGGVFGDILTVEPRHLDLNFRINVMALLHLVQSLAPAMVEAGSGAILATGNTSAYRGVASYAGFAPTKAAQRILLESAARLLGPKGVHVAYVAIDAVIGVPWARQAFSDKPDDYFCKPAEIAEECYRIAHQPRSTWAFDVVVRPFAEKW